MKVMVLSEVALGGCGIEGGADRVVSSGNKDGLAASVAFKSMACPFRIRS